MKSSLRIVTKLPLEGLWDDSGSVNATKLRSLCEGDIASLLRLGPVQFVVADVGHHLRWVELDHCYEFWKREVKPHLAVAQTHVQLDSYPDSYSFVAYEWSRLNSAPVIVVEKFH